MIANSAKKETLKEIGKLIKTDPRKKYYDFTRNYREAQ